MIKNHKDIIITRHLIVINLFIATVLIALIVPLSTVYADETSERPSTDTVQKNSDRSENRSMKTALNAMREDAKEKAKLRAESIKQEAKNRRIEIKKEVCERRQTLLSAIPSRVTKNATVVQDVLDRKYTKVQDFYTSKNLSLSNYADLKNKVDIAQSAAQTAVTSLGEFNFTVNCDSPGIGQQLDGLRSATTEARSKLRDYRKALVELIKAIGASLEAKSTETTGGTEQ